MYVPAAGTKDFSFRQTSIGAVFEGAKASATTALSPKVSWAAREFSASGDVCLPGKMLPSPEMYSVALPWFYFVAKRMACIAEKPRARRCICTSPRPTPATLPPMCPK